MSVVAGETDKPLCYLPLLGHTERPRAIFRERGKTNDTHQFLADVARVRAWLPPERPVLNLCQHRYEFAVTFAAAAANGQYNLLPPSRAPRAVTELQAMHADSIAVVGHADAAPTDACIRLPTHQPDGPSADLPQLPADQCVAIGYTSGSTGQATAHRKLWGQFVASNERNLAAISAVVGSPFELLATVPPQHMYGIETTVLLPLGGPVTVACEMPFYPADVVAAIQAMPAPRVLVTTPLHLRTLLDAGLPIPPLGAIVSATAPMPVEVAQRAEERSGAVVLEFFGSTETCVIARRQTVRESDWALYDGVQLQPQPDGTRVSAPWLPRDVLLADLTEQPDSRHFSLRGRQADLLEIAGKRASLADLGQRLKAIAGVDDAVVMQAEHGDSRGARRLVALVVAPELDQATILAALRPQIDPVFLPRPLYRVAKLPRNAVGKLPHKAVTALLQQLETR